MSKYVLNSLALSELLFIVLLFVYSTPLMAGANSKYHMNTYGLYILSGIFVKQIPEKISKVIGGRMLKKCDEKKGCGMWELWRRPEGASDCGLFDNLTNKGVKSDTAGMPSGHSTVIAYLATILLLNLIDIKKESNININAYIVLIALLVLLVPASRVDSGCHTIPQVLAGVTLGFAIGVGYYVLEKTKLRQNETFAQDRAEFYRYFIQ